MKFCYRIRILNIQPEKLPADTKAADLFRDIFITKMYEIWWNEWNDMNMYSMNA